MLLEATAAAAGRGDPAPAGVQRAARSSLPPANNFDLLRLCLAIAVIFGHAFDLGRAVGDPLFRWTNGQAGCGMIAVAGFFAISGYLIAASAARLRSPREFLARRARRIYPGFIVALAITAFVAAPIGRQGLEGDRLARSLAKWAVNSIALNTYQDANAFLGNPFPHVVNGSLWTIKYEFACYVLVLIVAWIGGLRGRWLLPVLAGTCYAVLVAIMLGAIHPPRVTIGVWQIDPADAFRWFTTFLIGSLAWRFRIRGRGPVALALAGLLVIGGRLPGFPIAACLVPIAVPYVVLTLAFSPYRVAANFAQRVGGDYSYGAYLYAFPIQQCTTLAFGGDMHPLLNFAIAAPLALLCGIASWHGVEKHFVRRDSREAKATIVPPTA